MDITKHDNTFSQLCPSPARHHSSHGHLDLCFTCIPIHLKNSANGNADDEITNKVGKFLLPVCTFHEKNRCEMYCRECSEPVCALCAKSAHQAHDVTDIDTVLDDLKQRISAEVRELEEAVAPKFRRFAAGVHSDDFDAIIASIHEQEETLCKAVRDVSNQLRDDVAKQRRESKRKHKENQLTASKTEKELHEFIHNSKIILKSNDASAIINYRARNEQFRDVPKLTYPKFMPGIIKKEQISDMFGSLLSVTVPDQEPSSLLKFLNKPEVLTTLQSPYTSNLHRVFCGNADTIWTSGNDSKIYLIDGDGSVLKAVSAASHVCAMSLSEQQELIFSVRWPDTTVYLYDGHTVQTLIDLHPWCPRGLCHSKNGDLLVSMRTLDEGQSRVVRYSAGITETQVIQNDQHGKPLFSVDDTAVLLLAENGNGDICVADHAAETVVVVDSSGGLRFEYRAYHSPRSKHKVFYPSKISTDFNCQILINDSANDIVHAIDSGGDFIRYIEYPCNGGLSVDADNNLVVGDETTGEIRIIKYLQ